MQVLFLSETLNDQYELWKAELQNNHSKVQLIDWRETFDADKIEAVLAWNPPEGIFPHLTNIKLIQSLGMGVDHLFECKDLRKNVPISRIIDRDMTRQMCEYVFYGVLSSYRKFNQYRKQQVDHTWSTLPRNYPDNINIGILGLGELGRAVADYLTKNQFNVIGWSRTKKRINDFETFSGKNDLDQFLSLTDILVCLLPLTSETQNLIDYVFLNKLRKNAYIINPARGKHIVEEDLIRAINEKQISGALLDVFRREPLSKRHPFWTIPCIEITPHIAAQTNPKTTALQIAQNLRYIQENKSALNLINVSREY